MRLGRGAALRAAVVLAAGFVALRVIYRVIFGGAGGGGIVLVDVPTVRLSGPFEHVVLFGEVTTGGLAAAAISALPFAVLVLAVGVLAAVVDLFALLTRGAVRGPVRTVSRALVVAWSTFPALVRAVRRVVAARELRGERGAASVVVPVLEQTVERAVGLGASMEARGFASTRRLTPDCDRPASLHEVSLGYGDRALLQRVTIDFTPGTLTVVAGPTGSGKSTLLGALSGLFQHLDGGAQGGDLRVGGLDRRLVPPRDTAGFVGVVAQAVRYSFVARTVAEEIGFSLAIRGVAPAIVNARVAEIADRLGIAHLRDREVIALSAGEATLVAIGAAIAEHPVLLLVDEPLAELDEAARQRVIDVLDRLAHEAGVCVVVVEHALDGWGGRPDRWLELRDAGLRELAAPPDSSEPETPPARPAPSDRVVSRIEGLTVRRDDVVVVDDAHAVVAAGELVGVHGPNGAGKSSLLHAWARPTESGVVFVDDRDVRSARRRERRGRVALVPEEFDDLLFATTVAAECRRSDRTARTSGTAERFLGLLAAAGERSVDLLNRHPRDLSAGERLCLVIAIQLAAQPRVLLVDEPSRGLDASARALVGGALEEVAARGAAVVFATHDRAFARRHATRTLTMMGGRLVAGIEATT